jgi:hypothetical protein
MAPSSDHHVPDEYNVYQIKPIVEFLIANKPAVFNEA